jgi:hypothetical protein
MSDNPSRLEMLRFARRVVEQQAKASLAQLDRWIAVEERRERERAEGEARRPPSAGWLLERGLSGAGRRGAYVHVGGCWNAGSRSVAVSREEAVEALRHEVPACTHCRPDTELGLLD